jgi:hypothetical protein
MATCNGCGGIIGRDCFNPQECEWISRSMEIDHAVKQEKDRQYREIEKQQNDWLNNRYNSYPGDLYQPLFDHMADQHGVILTVDQLEQIMNIVKKMQSEQEAGSDEM